MTGASPPTPMAAREVEDLLDTLLTSDLSFTGVPGDYATHSLHAFAARFPPQIPGLFIEALTRPGETVLDPLVGSGTVLVEARLLGRLGVGFDLDPLAVMIAGAKSCPIDGETLDGAYARLLDEAENRPPDPGGDAETREFREYWFRPEVVAGLARLYGAISREADPDVRRFFSVVFSATIVAKSGGVSLARDLAHSRPHRDLRKPHRSVFDEFDRKLRQARARLESIAETRGKAVVARTDARHLPLRAECVDAIVTSPPYASAVDYVRAHKFALNWMGYEIADLGRLRREFLGAEIIRDTPASLEGTARETVDRIAEVDRRRSRHIAGYFHDLARVLRECHRVLRPGRAAVWVVGPSTIRGVLVDTPRVLVDLGQAAGFRLRGVKERKIDRDRRLLPQGRNTQGEGIEARVHREAVIGFLKDG